MKLAIYSRISTTNKGQNTETQSFDLREYGKNMKFEIYEEILLDGIQNPNLSQWINDATI